MSRFRLIIALRGKRNSRQSGVFSPKIATGKTGAPGKNGTSHGSNPTNENSAKPDGKWVLRCCVVGYAPPKNRHGSTNIFSLFRRFLRRTVGSGGKRGGTDTDRIARKDGNGENHRRHVFSQRNAENDAKRGATAIDRIALKKRRRRRFSCFFCYFRSSFAILRNNKTGFF